MGTLLWLISLNHGFKVHSLVATICSGVLFFFFFFEYLVDFVPNSSHKQIAF